MVSALIRANDVADTRTQPVKFPRPHYTYPLPHLHNKFPRPLFLSNIWQKQQGEARIFIRFPSDCTGSAQPLPQDRSDRYFEMLQHELKLYGSLAGHLKICSITFSGGDALFPSPAQLESLLEVLQQSIPTISCKVEISFHASADVLTCSTLKELKDFGINHVRVRSLPNRKIDARVLNHVRAVGIRGLDIDLPFGLAAQSAQSWQSELAEARTCAPSNIYLRAPLFSPEPTECVDISQSFSELARAMYDFGVRSLEEESFVQRSFTRFTDRRHINSSLSENDYKLAEFAVIGIGAGSLSHTDQFEYRRGMMTSVLGLKAALHEYLSQSPFHFQTVQSGVILNHEDRLLRHVILNLLHSQVSELNYKNTFQRSLNEDFGLHLSQLREADLMDASMTNTFRLSRRGLANPDLVLNSLLSTAEGK